MKTITLLKTGILTLLALSIINCQLSIAQVSTNKAFFLGTNNCLPPNETNFFAVNSNLLNASVASPGGFTGNPSQFSSAGGMSNIISGAALTNINAQGISNSGYAVVVGSQTNSNTFRIYQGNFSDLMDWYGTGGSIAYMDHLANFTTLGNITAGAYNDNQGFHSDGTGDVFANNATIKTNIFAGTNEYLAGTNFPNYEVVSNNLGVGGILSATNAHLQTPYTTNLTEKTNINFPGGRITMQANNDGYAGEWLLTNGNVILGTPQMSMWSDYFGDFYVGWPTGGNGGVFYFNPPTTTLIDSQGGFQYSQQNGSGFVLLGSTDNNGGVQEVMDIAPSNFFPFLATICWPVPPSPTWPISAKWAMARSRPANTG